MAEYRPDFKGLDPFLVSAPVHKLLIDACFDEGIPFAKAISPDALPYGEGYIDEFFVDGAHTAFVAGHKRAACYLGNDSEYAAAVEWGWSKERGQWADHPGYHVLAMTADHLGGII